MPEQGGRVGEVAYPVSLVVYERYQAAEEVCVGVGLGASLRERGAIGVYLLVLWERELRLVWGLFLYKI
jgi:hypothetical protein